MLKVLIGFDKELLIPGCFCTVIRDQLVRYPDIFTLAQAVSIQHATVEHTLLSSSYTAGYIVHSANRCLLAYQYRGIPP